MQARAFRVWHGGAFELLRLGGAAACSSEVREDRIVFYIRKGDDHDGLSNPLYTYTHPIQLCKVVEKLSKTETGSLPKSKP